ncbi:MAG TPA: FAD-binding oxidoreductase [Stellaceae bacterium]|nr:FAD-binding oxidoreductase [Stellaceae bacterium]
MAKMNMAARSGLAAARELRAVMQGKVVLPGEDAYRAAIQGRILRAGEDGYSRARKIWNGAIDHYPALFALCETVEDVQAAIGAARRHGLALSVRGGGYDWAGRALCHGGMVIDLSAMRSVTIDPAAGIATVAGGATGSDLAAAAAPHGLAAVTGTIGGIGIAGLTLGGGYGPLSGRCGLALDNLLEAEMVLADGGRTTADATENADLFWALRGGGGNFGVVASMRVRLHAPGTVLAGLITFPWPEAEAVLRGYAEIMATAPDELTVQAGMLPGVDGEPMVYLAPAWSGEPAGGQRFMAALQRLGSPAVSQIGFMSIAELLGRFDAHLAGGRNYAIRTRSLPALTPRAVSAFVAAGKCRTSPHSAITIDCLRGAATRVRPDATAFGLREPHFMVGIVAAWEPAIGDGGAAHRQWARALSDRLASDALAGSHASMLGPDDQQQTAFAYGGNAARLQYLKRRFDPDGIFASAIALPARRPRGAGG